MKKICVSVVGGGQLHEITIQPGTTAGDILRDLNLQGFLLSKTQSADFFAATESIYEKVAEGQKIYASTKAEVGGELLDSLTRNFSNLIIPKRGSETAPLSNHHVVFQKFPGRIIRRHLLAYWQEAGWSKIGTIYRGNYQTAYGAFQGWIEERSPFEINFFILEPPDYVLDSSHSACFQPSNQGWFHVHMSTRPKDVSSGILTIERLIAECARNGG